MPAIAPVLIDELVLCSGPLVAADESGDVECVVELSLAVVVFAVELPFAEVLVPFDDVGVADGMKSTIVMVCRKSMSGAGASNVSLKLVEQAVLGLQQAHELLLEL